MQAPGGGDEAVGGRRGEEQWVNTVQRQGDTMVLEYWSAEADPSRVNPKGEKSTLLGWRCAVGQQHRREEGK